MSTGKKLTKEIRDYFSQLGKKNGADGGRKAAANMTKQERKIRALKAVAAREAKRKAASKEGKK